MTPITLLERDMTPAELARMNQGFDEHALANGAAVQSSQRFGFVALDDSAPGGAAFIGCASGLAYKNGEAFSGWFYLTDLYVEKAYRRQGIGARLLRALEDLVQAQGVSKIYTWTAGYEGPAFYQQQGYTVFTEQENWYSNGHSRIGLRKNLHPRSPHTRSLE
jgi:GNAT superfamily N-acetyltransferase